jgi:hypothetical protein
MINTKPSSMKKMITLLVAVIATTTLFAQTAEEKARARDKVFGNHKNGSSTTTYPNSYPTNYPNTYPGSYPSGSREAAIDQVNRDYDAKIASIQNNPYLSAEEKDRQIRQLNRDRQRRIDEINRQYGYGSSNGGYSKKKGKHHDDEDDDDRYEKKNGKGNNGKHLGWEKGKGNPHKGKGANWKD